MRFEGLTELQNDLLESSKNTEGAMRLGMRNAGNAATREARKFARRLVKKQSGDYHKSFKRGKVFTDSSGALTVRVLNKSNHGHLLEYGHRQVLNPVSSTGNTHVTKVDKSISNTGYVTNPKREDGKGIGKQIGFVKGLYPLRDAVDNYAKTGYFDKELGKAIDTLLKRNKL